MQNGEFGVAAIVGLMIVVGAVVIASTVFWVLMIIDCVKRKKLADGERVAWILVLIFLGYLGAGIYYFVVRRN